jgi:fibronectin-binding autotransporter adhesin
MKTKPTFRHFLTLAASTLLAATNAQAAILNWDAGNTGNGSTIDPANGTWNTTAGNIVWNNAGTNVVWSSANEAVFGGSGGPYAITVAAVTAQKITFASSNYTLSGAVNVTITPVSGNPILQVDSGAVATIGAGTNIVVSTSANLGQATGSTAAGTLNIDGAGAVIRPSNNTPGWGLSGNGFIVNVKNGTLRTSDTANGNSISVGAASGSDVNLNVSATGAVRVTNTGGLVVGGSGKGTVTQTGGTISMASTSTVGVTLGNAAAVTDNTFNLDGGVLTTPIIKKGAGTGNNVFNFNGGTVTTNASKTDFMQGLDAANVKSGGAIINTNGFNIRIAQDLLNDGGGGLTKNGAGTLTLAGVNTYAGATTVNLGTLALSTDGSSASDMTVLGGATLAAVVAAEDNSHINSRDLSLNTSSTLRIDYGSNPPSQLTAPLQVRNFTLGTTITLSIVGSVVPNVAYPLVTWTTSGPADGSAFSPVLVSNLPGTLSVAGNTLSITFAEPPPIFWNTGNGTWDTTTTNWLKDGNSSAFTNAQDAVTFGDVPSVFIDPVVTLDSIFTPFGVKMDSTLNSYTISGSGAIAGATGLTLETTNTRTLTLKTANTYTGSTQVKGGFLRLGNGDANGSLSPSSPIIVSTGTSFGVNQNDLVSQGTDFGVISGGGGFAQVGSGTTVFNSANTFTGDITINNGTLRIGTNGRLGTPADYSGSIVVEAAASVFEYGGSVSQTIFGAISGMGSIVKTGGGSFSLAGSNSYTGPTVVNEGILSLDNSSALGSDPGTSGTSAITLGSTTAATLTTQTNGIVIDAPITLGNTGVNSTIAFARTTNFAGSITLKGPISGNGNLIISSPNVGGSIGLAQSFNLGATGNWAGSTTLTAGNTQVAPRLSNTSGAPNVLPVTTVLSLQGGTGAGTGRFLTYDLNGQNQTLAGLQNTLAVDREQRVTSGTPATLTINSSTDYTFGGTIGSGDDDGTCVITGSVSLVKSGTAKFTLLGGHTYTGSTTVNQGILALNSTTALNNASTVTIATDGVLELNYVGTDQVGGLVVNGVTQPDGVYGAAQHPGFITGTGTLTVVSVGGAYSTWASANAGGQAPGLDFDNDGTPNGVEFFMNSPAGFTANPQLNALNSITWPNGGNIPASGYGTQFVIQTSPNLSTWTDVLIGDLTTNTNGPGGSLTYTLTGGSPRFVRLKVTPN